jgi:hypothetical protein
MFNQSWNIGLMLQSSTLPQGNISIPAKLVPDKGLVHNVSYLLICGYVMEPHCSFLHHVSDEFLQDPSKSHPALYLASLAMIYDWVL